MNLCKVGAPQWPNPCTFFEGQFEEIPLRFSHPDSSLFNRLMSSLRSRFSVLVSIHILNQKGERISLQLSHSRAYWVLYCILLPRSYRQRGLEPEKKNIPNIIYCQTGRGSALQGAEDGWLVTIRRRQILLSRQLFPLMSQITFCLHWACSWIWHVPWTWNAGWCTEFPPTITVYI